MAKVHILNVTVHNNPAPFFTPFQFEIHFECLEELQEDLEFKIIYVGSAETYEFDQVLDQIVVDAVPQGQFKFMFQADPPDTSKIPADDAVGVTVVLITASFRDQEFVRVGYYVTNEYDDLELRDNPPTEPQFNKLIRTIAANEPRVTKFKINWEPNNAVESATENAISENTDAAMATEPSTTNGNDDSNGAIQTATASATSVAVITGTNNSQNTVLFQSANSNSNQNGVVLNQNLISTNKLENKENFLSQQLKSLSDLKINSTETNNPINPNLTSNQNIENNNIETPME